jgi:Protein phosphatase 2C
MEVLQWKALTCSVVGDSHISKGVPNQDAIRFCKLTGNSPAYVMAVSDGHGSEKCPRSRIGSALAVEVAVRVFNDFWNATSTRLEELKIADRRTASVQIERHIRKDITEQLAKEWGKAVDSDLALAPLKLDQGQPNRLQIYGATLTVVFHCEYFSTCMQLGDCEVLIVDGDSNVKRIAPRNREQVGEETNSLCMRNAETLFSVSFYVGGDDLTAGIRFFLICSDGYEKAFKDNSGFEKSAIDFVELVSTEKGIATVEQEVESWLREYSNYSGDDVSLGLLFVTPKLDESAATNNSFQVLMSHNLPAATDAVFSDGSLANPGEFAKYEND